MKLSGAVGAQDIEGLGVSPAKQYGHVLGTDARFFGGGTINFSQQEETHPFQVSIRKKQSGSWEFKVAKGFVDGKVKDESGWKSLPSSQGQCIVLSVDITSDMELGNIDIKAETPSEPFRAVISGGRQTKAKIILAQFGKATSEGVTSTGGDTIYVIQNVKTNLMAPLYCFNGYAAKILVQEFLRDDNTSSQNTQTA